MPRYFTRAEAERLLAEVAPAIEEAIRLKAEYRHFEEQLEEARRRIAMRGGAQFDRGGFLTLQEHRDARGADFKTAVERIQGFGCIIKDIDSGLVDFPALLDEREVYLCWKLGEPAIQFWHGVEEGFAGRKPIQRDFK